MNTYDFSGQAAVVTGGAQGIGRAIVEKLAENDATVAIWDRDKDLAERTAGEIDKAKAVAVEITDEASVTRALEETMAALGAIHIVVHCAGVAGPTMPLADYPTDAWRMVVDVDLTGTFLVCKHVVPVMTAAGYGRIVNVASVAGKDGNPNASAYSAAKAGVIAITKSLGKELADHDIAVNCVTPAAAKTRIFDQMSQEHIDYMLSKIPRGRFLKVEEAANMVAWLVSKENAFTTAAVFDLSGGRATY